MSEKLKILVVEDDTAVASMMTYLLSRAGYAVETALTGRRGLELASSQKFDLITLDVDLPGVNGFDICWELKQRSISQRTPIIFLSGNAQEERRAKAFELGAVAFISKPFNVEDFLERVASCTTGEFCPSDVFAVGTDTNGHLKSRALARSEI
jgi:DNA-binding response OmpR family regulator